MKRTAPPTRVAIAIWADAIADHQAACNGQLTTMLVDSTTVDCNVQVQVRIREIDRTADNGDPTSSPIAARGTPCRIGAVVVDGAVADAHRTLSHAHPSADRGTAAGDDKPGEGDDVCYLSVDSNDAQTIECPCCISVEDGTARGQGFDHEAAGSE